MPHARLCRTAHHGSRGRQRLRHSSAAWRLRCFFSSSTSWFSVTALQHSTPIAALYRRASGEAVLYNTPGAPLRAQHLGCVLSSTVPNMHGFPASTSGPAAMALQHSASGVSSKTQHRGRILFSTAPNWRGSFQKNTVFQYHTAFRQRKHGCPSQHLQAQLPRLYGKAPSAWLSTTARNSVSGAFSPAQLSGTALQHSCTSQLSSTDQQNSSSAQLFRTALQNTFQHSCPAQLSSTALLHDSTAAP